MGEPKLKKWLTVDEVMDIAKCSDTHIRNERKRGNIRAYKPGRELLFDFDEVEKWIRRSATK